MRPGTRTGREKPDRAARARTGPGCRPTRPRSRSHPRSRAGHTRGDRRPHDRVTKVRDVPRVPRGRGRGPSPAMRSEAGGRRTAGPDREPLGRPRSRSVIVPGPHLRTDRTTTPAAPVVTPAAPGQAHHPGAAPRPTAASTTLPRGGRAAPHGRHRPGRLREGRGRGRPDPPSWTVDRVTGRPQSPSNAREPSPDHGRLLGPSPAHVRAGGRSRGRDLAYVAETSLTWPQPRLRAGRVPAKPNLPGQVAQRPSKLDPQPDGHAPRSGARARGSGSDAVPGPAQTRRRKTTFEVQMTCLPTVDPAFGASYIMLPPA